MSFDNYVLVEDPEFINFCKEKNIAPSTTTKKYKNHLKNYTNFHKMTLRELIDEADDDEENQVRMKRRKIRQRLIDFRTWMLIDKKFAGSTIKGNIISVKSFYKHHGIETPSLPNVVLNDSPNEHIEFEDLPTIDTIRTAMEATKKQNHKALILFAACTGSARKELVNFSFQQFLDGVAPFCHNPKNAQDIIDEIDGKCEELEIIPVFKMKRSKTDYTYYTPVTPECLQVMINYLKSEGLGLKPEDRFFQLGGWGVSSVFEQINDKFNWGKRGSFRFFSSHRIRKFHASVIEDTDFANYIQGRKPGVIKETYFKKDINRVREEYKKHMHKFNIYAHYDVMINSEAYRQLKEQFDNEQIQHKKEITDLEQKLADKDQVIAEFKASVNTQLEGMQKQMEDAQFIRRRSNIEKTIFDYINAKEDTIFNEKDIVNNSKKFLMINKIAYEIAIEEESKFRADDEYLESLVQRAIVKYTLNPDINQVEKKTLSNEKLEMLNEYVALYTRVWELIQSDDTLWNMVKNDQIKLKNIITHVIKKNVNNIDNLTDDDKKEIVQDVLMEYLTVD